MSALTKKIPHQVICQGGSPAFAVVPYEEFLRLAEKLNDDESDLTIPHEVVKANINGDSLIKAWREYLGMTQDELAAKAGMSQPAIAKIERAGSRPRFATLRKIANAMALDPAQLSE
ncbi:MAG TPA: XRE family transcriptional regulator [Geoalkalibacter subterraneus]|uniref:XRE family transcriptional regulator n=1 Tax=Geoalkalibacter subterraneus TaxID=483547 RepID=A0A831LHJ3_9BACT|nr:XRE family transcriptional regulator [Geoalkalibacter subterraneus]